MNHQVEVTGQPGHLHEDDLSGPVLIGSTESAGTGNYAGNGEVFFQEQVNDLLIHLAVGEGDFERAVLHATKLVCKKVKGQAQRLRNRRRVGHELVESVDDAVAAEYVQLFRVIAEKYVATYGPCPDSVVAHLTRFVLLDLYDRVEEQLHYRYHLPQDVISRLVESPVDIRPFNASTKKDADACPARSKRSARTLSRISTTLGGSGALEAWCRS